MELASRPRGRAGEQPDRGTALADSVHGDHAIELVASEQVRVGDARTFSLTIAPRPGHSISRQGPLVIDLDLALAVEPEPGIELPR